MGTGSQNEGQNKRCKNNVFITKKMIYSSMPYNAIFLVFINYSDRKM